MSHRNPVHQIAIYGPFVLADLRWLVEQCAGCDGDSEVKITGRGYGPDNRIAECINVHARSPAGGGGDGGAPR